MSIHDTGFNLIDKKLNPIWKKVRNGQRLTFDDGLVLYKSSDLLGIGQMARYVREKKHGNNAFFVVNQQINPTNICLNHCRFCCFSRKESDPDAYVMSEQEIVSKLSPEIREVHVVSGLYEKWSFEDYVNIVHVIHNKFPALPIKAYTAVEIDFFSQLAKMSVTRVLSRLQKAGVVCLPGGGAEVFSARVQKILFPHKIGWKKWLDIHHTAHELGIRSNATMLYGHIETLEERLMHMLKLRQLQDQTHGFLSFIPLAFQPGTAGITKYQTSGIDDLKTIAVSRLMLDNFDHIKSYWVSLGKEISAMALIFGADDVDGTVVEEKIMHAAKAESPVAMAKDSLMSLIHQAGCVPVERDMLYHYL